MKKLFALVLLLSVFASAQLPTASASLKPLPQFAAKGKLVFVATRVEGGTKAEEEAYAEYVKQLVVRWGRYKIAERLSEADFELYVAVSRHDTKEVIVDGKKKVSNILPIVSTMIFYPNHSGTEPQWAGIFVGKYFWEDGTAAAIQELELQARSANSNASSAPPSNSK